VIKLIISLIPCLRRSSSWSWLDKRLSSACVGHSSSWFKSIDCNGIARQEFIKHKSRAHWAHIELARCVFNVRLRNASWMLELLNMHAVASYCKQSSSWLGYNHRHVVRLSLSLKQQVPSGLLDESLMCAWCVRSSSQLHRVNKVSSNHIYLKTLCSPKTVTTERQTQCCTLYYSTRPRFYVLKVSSLETWTTNDICKLR